MSFAVHEGIHFTAGRGEGTWMPVARTFAGLDDAERTILSDWLDRVGARGIDLAVDLSVRPWDVADVSALIGVFEVGKVQASWLIVRAGRRWLLARCTDGFVSDEMSSLLAILDLIDPT